VSISLVLTVIGVDRPGLVEILSQTIADHEANWLESRMAHMAGKFAGILRVSAPEASAEALTKALHGLEEHGLRVVVESSTKQLTAEELRSFRLELVGHDRPGIVRDIARALSKRGVNVDDLRTECTSAPMTGGTLFKASAELGVPAAVSIDSLRDELEQIAHDLIVDIQLAELPLP
jgi:glycine cleavage system regulatory protein